MFAHEMRERRTPRVSLTDFTKAQLQFFFRLAYTGGMLPEEWPQDQEESESKGKGKKGYVKGKKGGGILTPRTFASLAKSDSDMFDSDSDDGKESKQRPPLDLVWSSGAVEEIRCANLSAEAYPHDRGAELPAPVQRGGELRHPS